MNPIKIILGVFFSFSSIIALAQPDPVGSFNKHVIEKWSHEYIRVSQYRVKGSPYLLGESFDGLISMKTGVKTINQKVLYDIMDQRVGTESDRQLVAPDGEITSFFIQLTDRFGGEKLEFINANTLAKSNVKGYLNVIVNGPKLVFLRQYKIKMIPDPQNMYSKEIRIFEQYYDYYLYNYSSQSLEKIKLKEKEIREFLQGFNIPSNTDFSKQAGVKTLVESLNL
jgi:hypothetical protein